MRPRELTEAMFSAYPPLGRKVALERLALLRDLPLVLDAILMRELKEYDTSFPAERAQINARFTYLGSLATESLHALTRAFANLAISPELEAENWVASPRKFEEDLSAYLWASHQMDAFRAMSEEFVDAVAKATPAAMPLMPRLTVAVLPPELHKQDYPLFRKLLAHGTLFSHVETDGSDGMSAILARLSQRAQKTQVPYGHWYIDGGEPLACPCNAVSRVSWAASEPVRAAVLSEVRTTIGSGSAGPEMLRSVMAEWKRPQNSTAFNDPLVDAFVQRVYGEGAGTQIFSTTFVQWSARELLRRAQPLTLVARYGPRQRQRSMNAMFATAASEMDFAGSAVDADFAAYSTWINLQRLPGAENAFAIAWSQHDGRAVAVGPGFPRGTESSNTISMEKLLSLVAEG
jgi:hypothetical protein